MVGVQQILDQPILGKISLPPLSSLGPSCTRSFLSFRRSPPSSAPLRLLGELPLPRDLAAGAAPRARAGHAGPDTGTQGA
eukprot:scaffold68125_cov23-Tisochrysis_lutea.AAC.2